MTHKTIMEYYPRHRSFVGRFVEIPELHLSKKDLVEKDEEDFFRRLLGANEIPIVYYNPVDEKFVHIYFCYEPVAAYLVFDDYEDFYLAIKNESGDYELFNPFNDYKEDEVIVAKTRIFEDFIEAIKENLVNKGVKKEYIFTSWTEMLRFIYEDT